MVRDVLKPLFTRQGLAIAVETEAAGNFVIPTPTPCPATFSARQVRSKGGILEAFLNVNARAEYENAYWTGVLDAQGKADGSYY